VPERQHSLRVVFDHSWKMFGAEERAVFSRLSVFRGRFTRAAARAVAGADLQILLAPRALLSVVGNGRLRQHRLENPPVRSGKLDSHRVGGKVGEGERQKRVAGVAWDRHGRNILTIRDQNTFDRALDLGGARAFKGLPPPVS